jgi:hypothetical protein
VTSFRPPLWAGNDNAAAFFLVAALAVLGPELRGARRAPSVSRWLLAGLFLGTSVACKVVALGFAAGFVAALLAAHGPRAWRAAAVPFAVLSLAALLAFAPWAIRGFAGSGNPLYPAFSGFFPSDPAYAAALRQELPSRLHDPRELAVILENLREKLRAIIASGDGFVLVLPVALAASCVGGKGRFDRFCTVVLGGFLGILILLRGEAEVGRFLAVGYPVAVVACLPLARRIVLVLRGRAAIVALLILAVALSHWAVKSHQRLSRYRLESPWLPVLSEAAVAARAHESELGGSVVLTHALESAAGADAHVLAPLFWYPAYPPVRLTWADEFAGRALLHEWAARDADIAAMELEEGGWTHLLLPTDASDHWPALPGLVARGVLEPVDWDQRDSLLYRVSPTEDHGNARTQP